MIREVFLYGTLLEPRRLRRHGGDLCRLRPAVLPGHARVALRGTPWPSLVPRPGAVVRGALLRPGAALAGLRAWEGGAYRLSPVLVAVGRQRRRALAFIGPRWRADG